MTALELIAAGHVAATLIVGFGQVGIVWYGIRAMQRSGADRAREHDQRHAAQMAALDAQGRRLDVLIRQSDESNAALRESTAALREVVTRTAPAAD